MGKEWWIAGVVVVIGLAWFGYSSLAPEPAAGEPIKIASVLGLTGAAAVDALNIQRGMELAKADLAKDGVVVDIQYEDDATDAAKTVTATQRLLAIHSPHAFVGFTWDFNIDAAAPVLIEKQIVALSPSNTSETANTKSPFIFYGSVANEKKLAVIAKYLREQEITRVALVTSQTTWGDNHADIVARAAAQAGATVVLDERVQYGSETTTIPSLVTKLAKERAGLVFITHSDIAAATLLKKMQEQGVDIPVIGTVDVRHAVERLGIVKTATSDWFAFVNPAHEEFVEKFVVAYGEEAGVSAENGYDSLMLMVDAIRNTDGSGSAISEYLRTGKSEYDGYLTDKFMFNEKGGLEGGTWVLEPVQ